MKHYRVNKVTEPDGEVLKAKDMLANNDAQALKATQADDDCPICDVWREGKKVGSVT